MKLSLPVTIAGSLLASTALSFPIFGGQAPLGNFFANDVALQGKPLVETSELQKLVNSSNLESKAETLYKLAEASIKEYGNPTRVIGSPGHWATVNYLLDELHKLHHYYHVSTQRFDAVDGRVFDYSLLIDGVQPKSVRPLALTPPTKDLGVVTGPLILIDQDGCDLINYPQNVTGAVALIKRGTCSFGIKSQLAGKAGAIAAIIYNNEPGSVAGTLGDPTGKEAPTLGLSQEDGENYVKLLSKGKILPTTVYINSKVEKIKTVNVIAQSRQGDQDNVIMLGAHSDSVSAGPGINDDGSGTISLLEVAQQLTNFQLNNSVRFAWWSAEEEGLLGSDHYVSVLSEEENSKIRLFMDYDMMASPNYAYQVYDANNVDNPKGSEEIKNLYIDWYDSQGLNHTLIPFDGRSDYVAFIDNQIPGGGIATGAEGVKSTREAELFGGKSGQWYDHCYHELCDDLTNVNYDAWVVNTKLIAHSIATYSRSLAGFPERETSSSIKVKASKSHKYHGPHLII